MSLSHIKNIACIGEVMIELIASGPQGPQLNVAGDTYNTAVYLRRLLGDHDCQVSYVTALGQDGFSDRILTHMTGENLDTSRVEIRPDLVPGLYAIETDDAGERRFTYWRGQSAARTMFQAPCQITLDHLRAFDLLYLSGISLAVMAQDTRRALFDFLDDYRAQGGLVGFDSNYRPRLWDSQEQAQEVMTQIWDRSDIALPSIDDEMDLFGDDTEQGVVERFAGFPVQFGALKRGAQGPHSLSPLDQMPSYAPAQKVVDTTAAGDSFNGAYLAALVLGKAQGKALKFAHDTAAKVITQHGAIVDV